MKHFVSPDSLLLDSYKLADAIFKSGFNPDFIAACWRGGAPVGIAVQEYLKYRGLHPDHISIRTSSYTGTTQAKEIRVHGLEYIVEHANKNQSLLLVDDIFDSGRSVEAVIKRLAEKMRANLPRICIATVYYKPQNRKTTIEPDWYIHTTNDWVVFPHELEDLTLEEIKSSKGPEIAALFE